jgi:hypothetical protein
MAAFLEGWQRPGWLLLILAIPLLYWWRSRSQRPLVLATGTLELWRQVAEQERAAGSARRRRPPSWVLWLLAAWLAAAVGVAEWRGRGRVLEPSRWLIVDARAAAFGPAEEAAALPGPGPGTTRLERAVREAVERYDDGARWQAFDGRRVRRLEAAELDAWFAELRAAGPAERAPDWSAWDRPDALWVAPSSAGLPRPREAGLWITGGAEVPGPVAREGGRWAWFEDDQVTWRAAPAWAPVQCRSADLPPLIDDFARAYAGAYGLRDAAGPCDDSAALEWRTHALPDGGAWEAAVAGVRLRVAVAAAASSPDSATLAAAGAGHWPARPSGSDRGADLLRTGPGWISCAAGEWQVQSGDPAALALELGRLADGQWRPEPGLLPSAARRAQGPPERRDPAGSAWNTSGGKRRGAGRFTALALALAAGAAWFAASRRG